MSDFKKIADAAAAVLDVDKHLKVANASWSAWEKGLNDFCAVLPLMTDMTNEQIEAERVKIVSLFEAWLDGRLNLARATQRLKRITDK